MKFFTNKSIWSKIVIVLIFVLVFEFIVAKPSIGASITDDLVEGGGKLLTPVMSLVATLGDAIIGVLQDAIMGNFVSIAPVDVEADIWTILGQIVTAALVVVACIAIVVSAIASGGTTLAIIATIAQGVIPVITRGLIIGAVVIPITRSTGSAKINNISASIFPDTIKLPKTLYLPMFNYSPEEIFQGKILLFNVDFFGEPIEIEQDSDGNYYYMDNGEKVITSRQNMAADLSQTISNWYVGIRNIAIVAMMIVLLYIGIRMLLSTIASDKAKYLQMLKDWFMGLLILFLMHYIMAFSVTIVQSLTKMVTTAVDENVYVVSFPTDENKQIAKFFDEEGLGYMLYDANGNQMVTTEGGDLEDSRWGEAAYVMYPTNLLGKLRLEMQFDTGGFSYVGSVICYLVLVFLTCYFTFVYIRRVLYMAFLTMIAPLVAVTYPIDKINDGKAQGFTKWFREYIFNLLVQPMHLLLYYMLITSACELAGENIVYSIVAIGFMIPSEKLLRGFFGFGKAETPKMSNPVALAAGATAAANALGSFTNRGKSNKEIGDGSEGSSGNNSSSGASGTSGGSGGVHFASGMDGDVDEKATAAGEQGKIDDDQEALNQLMSEATTPEEKAYLGQEQAELDSRQNDLNRANTTADKTATASYSKEALKQRRKKISGRQGFFARNYKTFENAANKVAKLPGKGIRFTAKAAGTAGIAAVGLAAGIATGDPSSALHYGVAGAGAGQIIGRNVGKALSSDLDRLPPVNAQSTVRKMVGEQAYRDIVMTDQIKAKKKEYIEEMNKRFDRKEVKRMEEDGTINRYIANEVTAQNAATAELMRRDNPSMTQDQAITDAKYAQRVGDKADGPDADKWEAHFAKEFKGIGLGEKEATATASRTMKRVRRFNEYKKRNS